jgi:RHS repeat-associated protein
MKATYTYLADGTKADVRTPSDTGFVYLGSMVYNNINNVKIFESTNFGGGRINKATNGFDINYFITDHLGSTRVIVDKNGNIKEQKDYYAFGKEHENPNLITSINRWGFSGKEKQIVGNINYLNFGVRLYDEMRWLTPDPLAEKYYSISPYAYCANNPIKFIDPDGLYPRSILIYDAKLGLHGGYKFTQPAAHLLSLVSGVSRIYIDNTVVQERAFGQNRPWYSAKEGGGAITLGSSILNSNITYTENYFDDDPGSYNGHGYGQDVMEWLSLSAHEVGHLPQISKAGDLLNYVFGFAMEYIKNGHDDAPSEIAADKGYKTFSAFNSFVNRTYGYGSIEKLFNSDKREIRKIETITSWWNVYQETQKQQTKSFFNNFQNLEQGTYKWNGSSWEKQ